jgi:uncharacterized membrane protein HdeD (DUF308 family)
MKYTGIAAIVLGAIMLTVSAKTDLCNSNVYLGISFLLIIAGIIAHIYFNKKAQ